MLLSEGSLEQEARDHLLLHFARNGAPTIPCSCSSAARARTCSTRTAGATSTASRACSAPARLLVRRGDGQVAAQQLQSWRSRPSGAPPTRGGRAGRAARRADAGRPGPRVLHQRRLGVGRGRLEARPPVPRRQRRAAAHQGDRARHRLSRGHARGALVHRRAAHEGALRPPADPDHHVSNTNASAADGDDEAAFCRRLLDELEAAIHAEGPDTVAMIIAEPVQNSGGCLAPPEGYWPGCASRRPPRDPARGRRGHLRLRPPRRVARGRALRRRAGPRTTAKGLTSAYAPMGAVMVSERSPRRSTTTRRTLLHGITFAGHPLCAAIALRNLEIFERDGVLEHVRDTSPT